MLTLLFGFNVYAAGSLIEIAVTKVDEDCSVLHIEFMARQSADGTSGTPTKDLLLSVNMYLDKLFSSLGDRFCETFRDYWASDAFQAATASGEIAPFLADMTADSVEDAATEAAAFFRPRTPCQPLP